MPDGKIYVGWIYGDPSDAAQLKVLGVKGKMLWKADDDNSGSVTVAARIKTGHFSHCECTEDVMMALEDRYPAFTKDVFSLLTEKEYADYRREYYD